MSIINHVIFNFFTDTVFFFSFSFKLIAFLVLFNLICIKIVINLISIEINHLYKYIFKFLNSLWFLKDHLFFKKFYDRFFLYFKTINFFNIKQLLLGSGIQILSIILFFIISYFFCIPLFIFIYDILNWFKIQFINDFPLPDSSSLYDVVIWLHKLAIGFHNFAIWFYKVIIWFCKVVIGFQELFHLLEQLINSYRQEFYSYLEFKRLFFFPLDLLDILEIWSKMSGCLLYNPLNFEYLCYILFCVYFVYGIYIVIAQRQEVLYNEFLKNELKKSQFKKYEFKGYKFNSNNLDVLYDIKFKIVDFIHYILDITATTITFDFPLIIIYIISFLLCFYIMLHIILGIYSILFDYIPKDAFVILNSIFFFLFNIIYLILFSFLI